MSEEVYDASRSVPRAMIAVYFINYCLVFPAVVIVSYHIVSIDDTLVDPTLYPVIYVLRQSMSPTWITVLLTIMLCLLVCLKMTHLAAVTRDI